MQANLTSDLGEAMQLRFRCVEATIKASSEITPSFGLHCGRIYLLESGAGPIMRRQALTGLH